MHFRSALGALLATVATIDAAPQSGRGQTAQQQVAQIPQVR